MRTGRADGAVVPRWLRPVGARQGAGACVGDLVRARTALAALSGPGGSVPAVPMSTHSLARVRSRSGADALAGALVAGAGRALELAAAGRCGELDALAGRVRELCSAVAAWPHDPPWVEPGWPGSEWVEPGAVEAGGAAGAGGPHGCWSVAWEVLDAVGSYLSVDLAGPVPGGGGRHDVGAGAGTVG